MATTIRTEQLRVLANTNVATTTRVATSPVSVLLLPENLQRRKFLISTELGSANYVAFALIATDTNYVTKLGAGVTFEFEGYSGPVSLIRGSGTGNVQVTEL